MPSLDRKIESMLTMKTFMKYSTYTCTVLYVQCMFILLESGCPQNYLCSNQRLRKLNTRNIFNTRTVVYVIDFN